ncbi:ArsR/SmtB family transcription factor [Desulfoplanes formicivorans]|uniref:ArsR family transcriptional regulator n=1 Tax=Desulfoplanes formicivorans TaxID=1592317 RepID=A0A194AF15_9BACT|nr:metalloregulator ArsR/SmtB family transcription factor [Desulfoplanes formicivorans]GAU07374.1 ArsR family transcriptional regulator [Desulfoplanes formicivorans]
MLSDNNFYVRALKALSEPNRLRLFWLLVQIDERICVAEAIDVLGDSYYNVSRNLKTLLMADLVFAEKEGKWVFYTLKKGNHPFRINILNAVRSIPEEEFMDEIKKCKLRLTLRQNGRCVIGPGSKEWEELSSCGV